MTTFITNSEVQAYKRCKRKWWLADYRQLKLKEEDLAGPRALGTRIHDALRAYYEPDTPWDPQVALDRFAAGVRNDIEVYPDQEDEITADADLGQKMLNGYFEWLEETGADSNLEVIGPERTVRAPFFSNGEVELLGKVDLRVRDNLTEAQSVLDHKSVGSLNEPKKTAHMDEQMLMYSVLDFLDNMAHGSSEWTDGAILNLIRRVKRTPQAKPPFYDRHEVRHNSSELRSFWLRLTGIINDMLVTRQRLDAGEDHRTAAYPTPRSTCSWDCDFFTVCPMLDDEKSDAEGLIDELYEVGNRHSRYLDLVQ